MCRYADFVTFDCARLTISQSISTLCKKSEKVYFTKMSNYPSENPMFLHILANQTVFDSLTNSPLVYAEDVTLSVSNATSWKHIGLWYYVMRPLRNTSIPESQKTRKTSKRHRVLNRLHHYVMSVASDLFLLFLCLCFHKGHSGAMSASVMRTSGSTPVLSCQRPDSTHCAAVRLRFRVCRYVIHCDYTLTADSRPILILFSETPDTDPLWAHLPSTIKL